jgi:hypothetical protein
MARNVVHHVTRDDAREQIIAATGRRADDHAQLLAAIERGDIGLCACRHCTASQQERKAGQQEFHCAPRYPGAAARRGATAFTSNKLPRRLDGARQPRSRSASQITA